MIRRALARYAYPTTVLTLVTGICLVGGFLAVVAVPDLIGASSIGTAAPTPSATAAPSAVSAMGKSPIGIPMLLGADCTACHVTTSGGVGVKPIPDLGHPLKGFTDCTACHNPTGLVKTAPGHSSLHATDCLICHKEGPASAPSAAPMRPEHMGVNGAACTSCHGVDKHAPMPADMVGREDNCWICHNGPEFQYLFTSPSAAPAGSPAGSPGANYPLNPTPSPMANP